MSTGSEPLAGFAVGVTAARRHEELATLLERRGARVVPAPAIRHVPLADDAELLKATRVCVEEPLDHVVVTTGIGFRAWLEAADGWGMRDALAARLAEARIVARGPKARGAIRSAGLRERWSPESEECAEVIGRLLREDLAGARVAVQLYGERHPELTGALRAAGADVVEILVYRWARTEDPTPLGRPSRARSTRSRSPARPRWPRRWPSPPRTGWRTRCWRRCAASWSRRASGP